MIRSFFPVLTGLAAFAMMEKLLNLLAAVCWPSYAAALPTRSFSIAMLVTRLVAGAAVTFCAGFIASKIKVKGENSELWLSIALLMASVAWHIHIWQQYPSWYHFSWFAVLICFAIWYVRPKKLQSHSA